MNGLKLFFHNSKYTMLSMFRLKVTLFWTLAFPLLLATFMYMAFGNLFEKDEMFKTINVAVVESENDDTLMWCQIVRQLQSQVQQDLSLLCLQIRFFAVCTVSGWIQVLWHCMSFHPLQVKHPLCK